MALVAIFEFWAKMMSYSVKPMLDWASLSSIYPQKCHFACLQVPWLPVWFKTQFFKMASAAILDFWAKGTSYHQTRITFGILRSELHKKRVIGHDCWCSGSPFGSKLIFQKGVGGHFGFSPPAKNAGIFARDMEAYFILNGS